VKNPAVAWELQTSTQTFTASAYTSEDACLEDVVRKLVKAAFKGRDRLEPTSIMIQANWQEGSGEGSYFTGTATVVV
jgi:hypothetical protein